MLGLITEGAGISQQSLICFSIVAPSRRAMGETAIDGYTPLCFGLCGVVFISCKVNFHVVRSAFAYFNVATRYIFADHVFFSSFGLRRICLRSFAVNVYD